VTEGQQPADARRPSLVSAALATYATNLAVAILLFVNALVVARALGVEGRGDIAFLLTVATLMGYLASFGIQEANANLAGSEPGLRRALASNSILFGVVFGLLAAAVVVGLVTVFPEVGGESERVLLWTALGSIPLVILRYYLMFLVQADYAFAITNLAWLLGPVTSVVTNSLLAALGLITVGTALGAWIGGQALGVALLVVYVARHAGFGRPDARLALRSLGFGSKTHVGRFAGVGTYRVDQWFLGSISGSRELGLYSIAVSWAEMLYYLSGVLVMLQRPDLVRAGPGDAARIAARVVRVALLLALPMALVLIVAAPVLCVTVFGEEFRGSVDDLRILALGVVGVVTLDLLGSALNAQRRPMLASGASSLALVVTLALDIALIPPFGGAGAAAATALAYTVGGLAAAILFTRAIGGRLGDFVPRGTDLPWLWRTLLGRFGTAGRGTG
jgi:O-antigen/teichoic acid export membrane protein